MSEEIIKVLDALSDKVGIAVDWTSNNVVPYLQEISIKMVNYELWMSVLGIFSALIVIAFGIMMHNLLIKNKDFGVVKYTYSSNEYFFRNMCYIAIFLLYLIGAFIIKFEIQDIITCLVFPEKIIIEQIQYIYVNLK